VAVDPCSHTAALAARAVCTLLFPNAEFSQSSRWWVTLPHVLCRMFAQLACRLEASAAPQ